MLIKLFNVFQTEFEEFILKVIFKSGNSNNICNITLSYILQLVKYNRYLACGKTQYLWTAFFTTIGALWYSGGDWLSWRVKPLEIRLSAKREKFFRNRNPVVDNDVRKEKYGWGVFSEWLWPCLCNQLQITQYTS